MRIFLVTTQVSRLTRGGIETRIDAKMAAYQNEDQAVATETGRLKKKYIERRGWKGHGVFVEVIPKAEMHRLASMSMS